MLKTRRQRSFWARIKLSMIISKPRRALISFSSSTQLLFISLNWFTIKFQRTWNLRVCFWHKTYKKYWLYSQLFPSLLCQTTFCCVSQLTVATVNRNIYPITKSVNTYSNFFWKIFNFFSLFCFFYVFNCFYRILRGLWRRFDGFMTVWGWF